MPTTYPMFMYDSQDPTLAFPPLSPFSSRRHLIPDRSTSTSKPTTASSALAGALIGASILVPVLGLSSAAFWWANRSALARFKSTAELEALVKATIGKEAILTRAEMSMLKGAMRELREEVRAASVKAQVQAQIQSEGGKRGRIGPTSRRSMFTPPRYSLNSASSNDHPSASSSPPASALSSRVIDPSHLLSINNPERIYHPSSLSPPHCPPVAQQSTDEEATRWSKAFRRPAPEPTRPRRDGPDDSRSRHEGGPSSWKVLRSTPGVRCSFHPTFEAKTTIGRGSTSSEYPISPVPSDEAVESLKPSSSELSPESPAVHVGLISSTVGNAAESSASLSSKISSTTPDTLMTSDSPTLSSEHISPSSLGTVSPTSLSSAAYGASDSASPDFFPERTSPVPSSDWVSPSNAVLAALKAADLTSLPPSEISQLTKQQQQASKPDSPSPVTSAPDESQPLISKTRGIDPVVVPLNNYPAVEESIAASSDIENVSPISSTSDSLRRDFWASLLGPRSSPTQSIDSLSNPSSLKPEAAIKSTPSPVDPQIPAAAPRPPSSAAAPRLQNPPTSQSAFQLPFASPPSPETNRIHADRPSSTSTRPARFVSPSALSSPSPSPSTSSSAKAPPNASPSGGDPPKPSASKTATPDPSPSPSQFITAQYGHSSTKTNFPPHLKPKPSPSKAEDLAPSTPSPSSSLPFPSPSSSEVYIPLFSPRATRPPAPEPFSHHQPFRFILSSWPKTLEQELADIRKTFGSFFGGGGGGRGDSGDHATGKDLSSRGGTVAESKGKTERAARNGGRRHGGRMGGL